MSCDVKAVGVLTAYPGKEAELRSLLEGLIGSSRSEPGDVRSECVELAHIARCRRKLLSERTAW